MSLLSRTLKGQGSFREAFLRLGVLIFISSLLVSALIALIAEEVVLPLGDALIAMAVWGVISTAIWLFAVARNYKHARVKWAAATAVVVVGILFIGTVVSM